MDSQPERNHGNVVTGGPGQARWQLVDWTRRQLVERAVPHLWINLEEQLGSETDLSTQCSSLGK